MSGSKDWDGGLFRVDGTCILSCLCFPFAIYKMGTTKSEFDAYEQDQCCYNAFCFGLPHTRKIIRRGYDIDGDCMGDCFAPVFCGPCALSQMVETVDSRGQNPKKPASPRNTWGNDLFACNGTCLALFICPIAALCLVPNITNSFDGTECLFTLCCTQGPGWYNHIRKMYGIEGSAMCDCLSMICCSSCAWGQLDKEVQSRGKLQNY